MAMKLLPALDPSLQPPAPSAGSDWGDHGSGLSVLAKYSAALSVSHGEVAAERFKSVPSPWARMLLFEQALSSTRHPAHKQIRAEWRGLLGAIGLGRYLGISISLKPVDLRGSSGVIGSLRTMAPRGDVATVWDRMALLYFDGQLLGGTSPRTLVFTGIRGISTGRVPFQAQGRLIDPTEHYSLRNDRVSLTLLLEWLETTRLGFTQGKSDLHRLLGVAPSGDGADPLPRFESLLKAFDSWTEETKAAVANLGGVAPSLAESFANAGLGAAFPSDHPAHAALGRITQVIPSSSAVGTNELQVAGAEAVVDPGASGSLWKDGHRYTGNIALPNGMSRQVDNGRFVLPTGPSDIGATWPDLGEFFESKLIPVRTVSRDHSQCLESNGAYYLYPFRPDVLHHLNPQDLSAWTHVLGEKATGLVVRLRVPLGNGLELVHERAYGGGDVYDQEQVTAPFITVWPDFESSSWPHYFYMERQVGTGGLELEPWSEDPGLEFANATRGLRWRKLKKPARAWKGKFHSAVGILIALPGIPVPATGVDWEVSIDFGSTHTRVFRSTIGVGGGPVPNEVHFTARARSLLGLDNVLPFNFFVDKATIGGPDTEAPSLIWLPTELVPQLDGRTEWLPPDGVMFWGKLEFAPSTVGLRGNLKWHRDDVHEVAAFHSYVSQLYLSIAAEAAAQGARVKSIITAYPSVLPSELRHRHRTEWRQLTASFGVKVRNPRSESDAVAAYYASRGAVPTVNLLAVDVGGSTSDLSVWINGQRTGDSIRLAGDLLSRVVSVDEDAREAFSNALGRNPFGLAVRWDTADPTKNGLILNSVLRTIAQNPQVKEDPALLARNLYDGPDSPGERVIAHLAYLFATVSYVLGLMARKHPPIDRYDIRFAGKGSEFLHWLEALASGAEKSLPSTFFKAGLNAPDSSLEVSVTPPGNDAKKEVGLGLLLDSVESGAPPDDHITFVGETAYASARGPLEWNGELTLDTLRSMAAPSQPIELDKLGHLNAFVRAFQLDAASKKAARALGLPAELSEKELRNAIHGRLFGPQSLWKAVQSSTGLQGRDMPLEPFFVTEAKVLLEHITDKPGLLAGS